MANKNIIIVVALVVLLVFMYGGQKQSTPMPDETPCDKFSCGQNIEQRDIPDHTVSPPDYVFQRGDLP